MELIEILKWPLVVMVLLLVFGRAIISLVAKYGRVRLKSKAIELTLEKLKEGLQRRKSKSFKALLAMIDGR